MVDKSVFCVSYELKDKDKNYEGLVAAIKSFGFWWHQTNSVWFIASGKSSKDVCNYLKQFIYAGDKLLVIEVHNHWAGVGFTDKEYNWLREKFD